MRHANRMGDASDEYQGKSTFFDMGGYSALLGLSSSPNLQFLQRMWSVSSGLGFNDVITDP